jgi:hypothetical protein
MHTLTISVRGINFTSRLKKYWQKFKSQNSNKIIIFVKYIMNQTT